MKEMRKRECEAVIDHFLNDITFYFAEHPNEIDEWAEEFKKAFNKIIDSSVKEIKEGFNEL